MSSCHTFRPVPGQCGPRGRGPLPAPPFDPQDYWATRKLVSSLFGTLETSKLDRADVVDPASATEDGKAADAKKTKEELDRISGAASGALALAESKQDKLSSRQLEAVNSGIDAGKVAKIAQNESAISAEVSRATTEEARLQALVNAIKTFDAVVADSLPSPSEQYSRKLYLVPSTNPETQNVRDEFICVKIEDVWKWEQVGSTTITIEFDDEPTEGSQKVARSGGIWSFVNGIIEKLTLGWEKITGKPTTLAGYGITDAATKTEVANKADKTTPYADGNLAALTADGNLKDSGKKASDFAPAVVGGYLPLNDGGTVSGDTTFIGSLYAGPYGDILGVTHDAGYLYKHDSVKWYYGSYGKEDANEIAVKGDVSGLASSKADKPALPVTEGNLAALTADGNLRDSNINLQDVALMNHVNYMADQDSGFVSGYGDGFFFSIENGEQRLAVLKGRVIVDRDGKDAGERGVAMLGDINSATRGKADLASFAPEYSATSAYSADEIVHHDGSFYQCKTAIAEGGEAWNAEHWELRKLNDFFTESNSLLTATIAANSARLALDEDGEIIVTMNTED